MPRLPLALCLLFTVACAARPQPSFVLLLTFDTLRADHVGAFGGPAGLTPQLDRLASESTVFLRSYSPASFTLPALAALATSRHPAELGVVANDTPLPPSSRPMAHWLRGHGYRTAAVVSNYVLRRKNGFARGFGSYDARFPQLEAARPVPERIAPDTTRAALEAAATLARGSAPAFLWVHYQDPHGPYTPPESYRARHIDATAAAQALPVSATQSGKGAIPRYQYLDGHDDVAFYRAGYRGEVAYLDDAVGSLLEGLKALGLLERAVIVAAADHGEELGEGGYYFSHGENLSECLLRVPLLVRVVGRPPARRTDVASLLDVLPTLAGVLGLPAPERTRGRDLLAAGADALSSEVVLSRPSADPRRTGLIALGHRLVSWPDGRASLYALGTEEPDLAPRQPELLARLRRSLDAAALLIRPAAPLSAPPSPEEAEALRALGYVASGAKP